MSSKLKYLLIFVVFFAGCNSDLYTKQLATEKLKHNNPIEIVTGFFGFKYAENEGAAFSLFHQLKPNIRKPLLVSLHSLLSLGIFVFIWINRRQSLQVILPFLIILSGSIGNLINRIQYGYVVDFIHLHFKHHLHWPIFNVADILICIGLGLVILHIVKLSEHEVYEAYFTNLHKLGLNMKTLRTDKGSKSKGYDSL